MKKNCVDEFISPKKILDFQEKINSLVLGDGRPPTFDDGNPYNGYINPYGLGLMSLSPIIWK